MTDSGYDFYLDKCLLPVAPPKLQVKINNNNDTVKHTYREGEHWMDITLRGGEEIG